MMYINEKDITLQEIADAADVSVSTLRSFVYGDNADCRVSMVVKLAKVLNVSCDELLGAGTISEQTCQSLQLVRMMPESFTHFVRWAIHYHYDRLTQGEPTSKLIEIMRPICADNGNIKMTNDFDIIDIKNLGPSLSPKIFMGIRIPCNHYVPNYFKGDILLLANDRCSRKEENVVVAFDEFMWIVNRKEEIEDGKKVDNFYSLRDSNRKAPKGNIGMILGYVAYVIRCMD